MLIVKFPEKSKLTKEQRQLIADEMAQEQIDRQEFSSGGYW